MFLSSCNWKLYYCLRGIMLELLKLLERYELALKKFESGEKFKKFKSTSHQFC